MSLLDIIIIKNIIRTLFKFQEYFLNKILTILEYLKVPKLHFYFLFLNLKILLKLLSRYFYYFCESSALETVDQRGVAMTWMAANHQL